MIKWGIVGLGNMANVFANAINATENSSLISVASNSKNKLEVFQKKFKIKDENIYGHYNDLISSKNIDAIYIATLNNTHVDLILKCAENDKKILCEKPIGLDLNQANLALKSINKNNTPFYEAIAYRSHIQTEKIIELIDMNEIGEILKIEAFFGFKVKRINKESRLFNKDLGGGAILDIGCYPLSISTFVNSLTYKVNIEDIKLEKLNTLYCESGVDIFSQASLNFDNKFFSKINCSFKDNLDQCTKINFENGSLTIDETWIPNQKMSVSLKNQNEISKIDFFNDMNIYAYQIKAISGQLLDKKTNPTFPSITMEEIEINTKIIEDWINSK